MQNPRPEFGEFLIRTHGGADITRQVDRALLDLLSGNSDRAIATWELATRDPSTAAEALVDLSAAYLARFKAEGDPVDLLRAADAAERSLSLDGHNRSSLFNRAEALTLLGTRNGAKRAWGAFMREPERGWAEEARASVKVLQRPTVDDEWNAVVARVELGEILPSQIDALTVRYPWNARLYAEEVLLPRWATESSADPKRAASTFALASSIGTALARDRGETLTDEAVRAAKDLVDRGTAADRAVLFRGLQSFGVGVAQFNDQHLISAKESLTTAARDLTASGNPLRFWARFYLAVNEYYGNASRGLVLLHQLLAAIPSDRYPALTGRIHWIAGSIDKVQERMQSSVHRYGQAAVCLRKAGGERAAAFAMVLLAESYRLIGEDALAWQSRFRAFTDVPLSDGPRYNIAMWTEATEALSRAGNVRLAGPLIEEAIADADRWQKPFGRATVCIYRAIYRIAVGKVPEARADVRAARTAIAELEPSRLRDFLSYRVLIAEGLCEMTTSPAHAAELLKRGLGAQLAAGTRFDSITFTTELARAQLAAGQTAAGAATLERAVTIFENIRSTVEDPVSRMQAFRQAQPAFNRLIGLRVMSLADDGEAFRLTERSRARMLLEMAKGESSVASFASLAEVQKAVPRGTVLVSYVILDEHMLAWVVMNGGSRRVMLPVKLREIENQVERFRLELTRNDNEAAIRNIAAPLYDSLIRPLTLPSEAQSLIVVPDRVLARLSFSALFDRQSGRYLIEQRTVSIAPSATLLVRGRASHRNAEAAPSGAVVFAVGRPGSYHGVSLPPLPQAEREGKAVAAIYPGSDLFVAESATRENFLRLALSRDVIHFAGHAVVDLNVPRRSVLLFVGTAGTLEPLSLGNLFDAGGGAPTLVVLSACRTQDSLADEREGLLGLSSAFIAGGAREVVASPLDVDDRLAPSVMAAFHRHYRERRSAAAAMRDAVVELRRSTRSELRSPAAWGGFTVIKGRFGEEEHL